MGKGEGPNAPLEVRAYLGRKRCYIDPADKNDRHSADPGSISCLARQDGPCSPKIVIRFRSSVTYLPCKSRCLLTCPRRLRTWEQPRQPDARIETANTVRLRVSVYGVIWATSPRICGAYRPRLSELRGSSAAIDFRLACSSQVSLGDLQFFSYSAFKTEMRLRVAAT